MRRRFLASLAALGLLPAARAQAAARAQRLLIQISDYDPRVWGLALSNARNVRNDLGPDKVQLEGWAYARP